MPERAARLELGPRPLQADAEPLELLARLAGADPVERGGAGAGGDQVAAVALAGAGHDLPGRPLPDPAAGCGRPRAGTPARRHGLAISVR